MDTFPPFVSVIIPCRNEEKYIRKCVDSLLKQDYPDFEIILVNDESSDKTLEIMKEYTKEVTNCPMMAEVQLSYKSKVKSADRPKLSKSHDCYKYLQGVWDAGRIEHIEEVFIVLLNRANRVIGWSKISVGGINACYVDVKVIMQTALVANASAIILAHNHPSGNTQPSSQDIEITKKVKKACELLEISLLDHIIITPEDGFYSFADEGVL